MNKEFKYLKNNKENVEAYINFIVKQAEKPKFDSSALTGSLPKLYFKTEKRKVYIKNLRNSKTSNELHSNGFEYHIFPSSVDLSKIEDNIKLYTNEIETFLKNHTGADEIVVFDYTKRSNGKRGALNPDGYRKPADRAHVDYTDKSGPQRAIDVLGKDKYYKVISTGRIIQLNLWRPLCHIVKSAPIAFCFS